MKEAELLFTPGCEAGSDKCDGCALFKDRLCPYIYTGRWKKHDFAIARWISEKSRFSQCLEDEAQAKKLRDKVERLEAIKTELDDWDNPSSDPYASMIVAKIQEILK